MTIWDKIYKNYLKGGPAWKSLSEKIRPEFKSFVKETKFAYKKALDIGCGDGRYLKYLEERGFTVSGLDSSQTSVNICRKKLGKEAKVEKADMFKYNIPDNQYDFIYSINTLQHGYKEQSRELIKKIYQALIKSGRIFITLPDESGADKWQTFKKSKKMAEGTFIPLIGPEKGLPHSFFKKKEIMKYFSDFNNINREIDKKRKIWLITGKK
ncbi:MAG: class I SAM-dependent methyltransferase [Patescibacteria group bacterium]|nr:class I SAM-dependent methyltransferase [Patescibacteria group bacterium]